MNERTWEPALWEAEVVYGACVVLTLGDLDQNEISDRLLNPPDSLHLSFLLCKMGMITLL